MTRPVITRRQWVQEKAWHLPTDGGPRTVRPMVTRDTILAQTYSLFEIEGQWGIAWGGQHTTPSDVPLRVQWFPDEATATAAWMMGFAFEDVVT